VAAGYPLDVEALLIVEVQGSEDEIDTLLEKISEIAMDYNPAVMHRSQSRRRAPRSGRAARRRSAPSASFPTITAWTV
jgi:hypothetical protein